MRAIFLQQFCSNFRTVRARNRKTLTVKILLEADAKRGNAYQASSKAEAKWAKKARPRVQLSLISTIPYGLGTRFSGRFV
jgi:hypothetical protein